MDFAELQAEMNIYNLCYWFINMGGGTVQTNRMPEMADYGERTQMPRPEHKGEEDGEDGRG